MERAISKLDGGDLAQVLRRAELPAAAAARTADAASVSAAVERLAAAGLLLEAARLLAHGLPKREAVWWACRCAAYTEPAGGDAEAERAAREAAELWVRQRTDVARRAAMERARADGFATPGAWAAVAAFWSGELMAPPDQPAVPPASHLTGTAVIGAVTLASVRAPRPERQAARLGCFLESAHDIAGGGVGHLPAKEGA